MSTETELEIVRIEFENEHVSEFERTYLVLQVIDPGKYSCYELTVAFGFHLGNCTFMKPPAGIP